MQTTTAAVLNPVGEARIALETVDVQAKLRGLFAEVNLTQVYRNLEENNIEAIYTFPLPLDAVLLELTVELNGNQLQGVVQPKRQAEERYEDAIEEGDSAILLRQVEPGIFTFNVGNLHSQEKAVIRIRYAQIHRWQGDCLRFHLPTTIAPRYGDPSNSGLEPYEVPEYVLSADHGFSLNVQVSGALAQGEFNCPSHPVIVKTGDGDTEFSLSGGFTLMDRDFVLTMKETAASTMDGLCAEDGEEYVALASFHPNFPDSVPASPRCAKLVVDCSGSMSGNSITQAREAVREIISMLKPSDYFNVIVFGSNFRLLFPEPIMASENNIRRATKFAERMDANMGGTEIGQALKAAYRCGTVEGLSSDLLLITDGNFWGHEEIVETGRKSGHRIFTVGVGSAVSEAFVRDIAESTSGACELVSPLENMSERIVRHFQRIDQPRAESVQVNWPSDVIRQIPNEVKTVYAGDTLHVYGWFKERPVGPVELTLMFEDGKTTTQEVCFSSDSTIQESLLTELPRVAAYSRLPSLDAEAAMNLAERYQLVTEHTSFILVYQRDDDERSGDVPVIRKIPQVVPAGWGGCGDQFESSRVHFSKDLRASPPMSLGNRPSIKKFSCPEGLGDFFVHSAVKPESREDWKSLVLSDRSFRRLKQGRFDREDELHLQGQTVEDAVDQLERFIDQAIRSGVNCMKVIYGDGGNFLDKISRIKLECQNYLRSNEFVLGFCQALPDDGGAGAMYVLLKKPMIGT